MRRFLLALVAFVAVASLAPGSALAHNSLDGSSPANGAVLDAAPPQIVWTFANDVPLETLTVTLTDQTGVRTEVPGSRHGPNGPEEVVTPLPALSAGEVSVRWRLVGADGHPITDTISFTINAVAAAPTTTAPASAGPQATATPPTAPQVTAAVAGDGDGAWSTPGPVRWLIRAAAYVAIMIAAGTVLTQRLVAGRRNPASLGIWLGPSLLAVAVTAALQLLIIGSDIGGQPLWSSIPDAGRALDTVAGMAFFIRVALALVSWALIVYAPPRTEELRTNLLVVLSIGLLATWSFAGHSRSMRWPALGVPLDVVHHGAAAAWLGGLTIIGLLVLPRTKIELIPPLMRRFSTMASTAVALIVATGLVQAVRLVGSPGDLLEAGHGRLLVAKLVVLVAMLAVADQNRRRVNLDVRNLSAAVHADVDGLRRMMLLELLTGLVIIGITAAMVVSAPATSGIGGG
jgi:copper transport protein